MKEKKIIKLKIKQIATTDYPPSPTYISLSFLSEKEIHFSADR